MLRYQTPLRARAQAQPAPLLNLCERKHVQELPAQLPQGAAPAGRAPQPLPSLGELPLFSPSQPIQTEGEQPDASGLAGEEIQRIARVGLQSSSSQLPYFEQLQRSFGSHDLSGIRAHQDSTAAQSSQAIGAKAFASGNDVVFARPPSLFTAAHEVAHIIQQQRGVHVPGGIGARNDAYEQQADKVADRVVKGQSVDGLLGAGASSKGASARTAAAAASAPLQMAWEEKTLRRRAQFRPGQGQQTGFTGWFANKTLEAGSKLSVDLDTSARGYRSGFVQARIFKPGNRFWSGYWVQGYVKEDAIIKFTHENYVAGDKFFGLSNPNLPQERQGGRYGYASQIPTSDPRYDEENKPTAYDFVNEVGSSIMPTTKGDLAMFDAFAKEDHWKNKPLPNLPDHALSPYKNRKAGKVGVGGDKASKVALLAIVKSNPTAKIRFILDGMNLEDVVKKDVGTSKNKRYGRSITAGELRFIYRHWQSDFKGRVVFYLNDQEVAPPWVSDSNLWSTYQPKNTYI